MKEEETGVEKTTRQNGKTRSTYEFIPILQRRNDQVSMHDDVNVILSLGD